MVDSDRLAEPCNGTQPVTSPARPDLWADHRSPVGVDRGVTAWWASV